MYFCVNHHTLSVAIFSKVTRRFLCTAVGLYCFLSTVGSEHFIIGVDEGAIQQFDCLYGGLAIEAHFGVHHVLHDAVAAGLMLAGRKHGSDWLGTADGTQRVLRRQRYI